MKRGRRDEGELRPGDVLDCWRVVAYEPPHRLTLEAEMRLPGRAWLQFEVAPRGERRRDSPDGAVRPGRHHRPRLLVPALPRARGDLPRHAAAYRAARRGCPAARPCRGPPPAARTIAGRTAPSAARAPAPALRARHCRCGAGSTTAPPGRQAATRSARPTGRVAAPGARRAGWRVVSTGAASPLREGRGSPRLIAPLRASGCRAAPGLPRRPRHSRTVSGSVGPRPLAAGPSPAQARPKPPTVDPSRCTRLHWPRRTKRQ